MKMARFGKAAGKLIAITGLLMLGIGFLYDLLSVNIPYQDPPPALQHAYELDFAITSGITSTIYRIGGIILLIGLVVSITQFLVRRRSLARRG
ncbi:MAG: hypothetical protein JWQ98_1551 [Chlorobi bacterium]|jgi:hypothetical protein|nr:hypothetical protein [Chlorobiota bacterium]